MYRGFILLRTDDTKIENFIENIFKDTSILIKIGKDSNAKQFLESSIKSVILDKNCKNYEKLFTEFSKNNVGIISIGEGGDITFPFESDEIILRINEKKLYMPGVKRINFFEKLSGYTIPLKNKKVREKVVFKKPEETDSSSARLSVLILKSKE